jgi:peptide/nickel transport system permease protein
MPGNPVLATIGESSYLSETDVRTMEKLYGLDVPPGQQFLSYIGKIARFDFGTSLRRWMPVRELVFAAVRRTLSFSLPALMLGSFLGILAGSLAGWRPGSLVSRISSTITLAVYAMPPNFMAILVLYVFAVKLELFPLPSSGETGFWGIMTSRALPLLTMSLFAFSRHFFLARGSSGIERTKVYPLFARSKGLTRRQTLFRHALPNALLPVLTQLALDLGFLVSGALFVEIVFSVNGMGSLFYDALFSRDYPLIQGILFLLMSVVLTLNLLSDVLSIALDPRIRDRREP